MQQSSFLLLLSYSCVSLCSAFPFRDFKILSSKEIAYELINLSKHYPAFTTLTTSQRLFGLPQTGSSNDCQDFPLKDNPVGCPNYIMTILDPVAFPPSSPQNEKVPEVFLSGALHGNERVGPTAVLETLKILLAAAQCESLPNIPTPTNVNSPQGSEWLLQIQQAKSCRQDLLQAGITDIQRKWLARLVSTRRIVATPMTNALGYDRNDRTEDGTDPNRDFPFDQKPEECMQTIAGRTINELFQSHLFQMSLTYHGGTEVIGYEWGAYPYLSSGNISPDHEAQYEIASAYSSFAGAFDTTKAYETGTMNELVYAVHGGMEDWAYAGSWDVDKVKSCTPKSYGGYPENKTMYNKSTLRAFNMLIETSNDKIPRHHLGSTKGLLNQHVSFENNGHVARNIRLGLAAIEFVQPYVSIWGVNNVKLQDDIVPLMPRNEQECQATKAVKVSKNLQNVDITWTVGGSFTVDYTTILYTKWDNVPKDISCSSQPVEGSLGQSFQQVEAKHGVTRWKHDWEQTNIDFIESDEEKYPVFTANIDTSGFEVGDRIAIFATARVDQGWKNVPDGARPIVPVQSHVVNARTNQDWYHESAGKVIQGQLDWYSISLTLIITDDDEGSVEYLSDRFANPDTIVPEPREDPHNQDIEDPNDDDDFVEEERITSEDKHTTEDSYEYEYENENALPSGHTLVIIVVAIAAFGFFTHKVGKWVRRRKSGRQRVNVLDEDDIFVNEFTFEEDIQLRELS